ncbi:hypothetical protein B0H16DRAFT_871614 [Mycena metata]|uniref:Uncharacterized protein n=1 Tax=Mycena metata TaxID=1033252 RepID=A0AAD7GGZ4_9AGAR|nr:hypothetical protein B0H16DRAFT_871614 [Mycena metata]
MLRIVKPVPDFFDGKEPNKSINPDEAVSCGVQRAICFDGSELSEVHELSTKYSSTRAILDSPVLWSRRNGAIQNTSTTICKELATNLAIAIFLYISSDSDCDEARMYKEKKATFLTDSNLCSFDLTPDLSLSSLSLLNGLRVAASSCMVGLSSSSFLIYFQVTGPKRARLLPSDARPDLASPSRSPSPWSPAS